MTDNNANTNNANTLCTEIPHEEDLKKGAGIVGVFGDSQASSNLVGSPAADGDRAQISH